ncbi:drug/metabolite transporter [Trametes meyenii]|nr:drug/metabolite transporter [Trametes meyenii]
MSSYRVASEDSPSNTSAQFIEDAALGGRKFTLVQRTTLRCLELFKNNTGLLLIALSQAFTSLMGVFVKMLSTTENPVPPVELIWVRMVLTWVVCASYMTLVNVPNPILGPREIRLLLIVRGLAGFVGLFGTYYTLQYLSLSDTTVLSFLTPMCTAVTSALLLKEDLTVQQSMASVFSFVGVILIARPDFLFGQSLDDARRDGAARGEHVITSGQRLDAVGVALLGVVGLTTAYTTIRAIGKRAHPMHNLAAFALVCIVTGPIIMLVSRTPVLIIKDTLTVMLVLAVSLCGFSAQITMTTGLQRETAGRGTLAIYVQVVFAMLFERIFFHSVPSLLSLLGTIIILSSAIYVALSKRSMEAIKMSSVTAGIRDDPMLEEGLLVHHEGESENDGYELDKL